MADVAESRNSRFVGLTCMYQSNLRITLAEAKAMARVECGLPAR